MPMAGTCVPSGFAEVRCGMMAFIPAGSFVRGRTHFSHATAVAPRRAAVPMRSATMGTGFDGSGKKPSKSRKFRPGKGAPVEKTKLEPETVFIETGPSKYELIIPTVSILTVIGIIPFVAAVARTAWVRYKITSRRISISSGFQGKDQTEIIYRDIEKIKYVRRFGGAADCVLSLKDGAKLEIRAVPEFDKIYEYILSKVDESARAESGAA